MFSNLSWKEIEETNLHFGVATSTSNINSRHKVGSFQTMFVLNFVAPCTLKHAQVLKFFQVSQHHAGQISQTTTFDFQ
jgi:hypothetical protein